MPCAADPSDAGQKGQEFRDAIAAKLEKLQEPPPAKQATVRGGPPVLDDLRIADDSFGPRPLARRSELTRSLARVSLTSVAPTTLQAALQNSACQCGQQTQL